MRRPLPVDRPIVERARAKLNLDLILTGKRPDGYHELDSVVAFPDIGDEVAITTADELRIDCRGPFAAGLAPGDGNIVHRAVIRLAAALGVTPGLLVRLDKQLPIASGIGGGSADAAATLRALARLWRLPTTAPVLAEVALGLGSDVLVCLGSRSTLMRGVGEQLEPLPGLPGFDLVLVNPLRPLATAEVFAAVRQERFAPRAEPVPMRPGLDWLRRSRNDLEAPARALLPEIDDLLTKLSAAPGCRLARMSGSGPTCFGLFDDAGLANAAAASIGAARPGWWVASGRIGDPGA